MTRTVFVDTSALLALLNADEQAHAEAVRTWNRLLEELTHGRTRLVTHSGILLECNVLVQRRLGMPALRDLHERLLPVAEMVWLREAHYRRGIGALFAAGRRRISLTDWISFDVMRERRIRQAFTFDRDFADQGFRTT